MFRQVKVDSLNFDRWEKFEIWLSSIWHDESNENSRRKNDPILWDEFSTFNSVIDKVKTVKYAFKNHNWKFLKVLSLTYELCHYKSRRNYPQRDIFLQR